MKRISSYLRMRVLSAIDFAPGESIRERIHAVSQMIFHDEDNIPHQFTWRTIQTWYSRHKKYGFTDFSPKQRADKGKLRKVCPETLLEAIESVKPLFHKKALLPRLVYKACIEKGILRKEDVSQTSFYRIVKAYDLLKDDSETENKKRLAFSKAHANDLWQADTLFGPFVPYDDTPKQTYLIAFIDDASRVVPHGQFFVEENVHTLIQSFRSALYKRGIPRQLYVDNGSIYTSKELSLICARLGCLLSHAPIRDGAAKGKIERFFRSVRDQFLSRKLDLSSLESLNFQFIDWLENHYNSSTHRSLGMKPIDRFGLDLNRIRFLPPEEANDELFFMEITRSVSKTNTFQLKNLLFEPPIDLRGKTVHIRFDRYNFDPYRVVCYLNNNRLDFATPVDFLQNDRFRIHNPKDFTE